jgi:hypothetical protein
MLSGATNVPLSAVPMWLEDSKDRSIILEGVGWMASVLVEAQAKLLMEPRDNAAEGIFQIVNA